MKSNIRTEPEALAHNPAARGYQVLYRRDEVNHCPSCGRTHWYVGRTLAECGFCATALPLSESYRQPAEAIIVRRSRPPEPTAFAA